MSQALRVGVAACLSVALAAHGLRKRSLSASGALAALVVGTVHMYSGLQPGALLLLFYFSSSKLTKYKAKVKAEIEHDFKEGGQRSAFQVLANSLGGAFICGALLCVEEATSRARLLSALLGHYAAACSDTWSSELGILSQGQPRFILTGKVVPKGTNGGVSALGLAAGVAGGLFMGACFWLASFVDKDWQLHAPLSCLLTLFAGTMFGLIGTLVDSVLGALLQSSTLTLQGRVASRPDRDGRHISGWDVLSNEGVNFLASNLTAAAAAFLLPLY